MIVLLSASKKVVLKYTENKGEKSGLMGQKLSAQFNNNIARMCFRLFN